jgi:hypothetical protein
VCFDPDGRRLACGSWDKTVKVYDVAGGSDRRVLKGHAGDVAAVAFSPDGSRIVAQSSRGEVRSWDAVTGQEIVPCADPPPPGGQTEAVSPDRRLQIRAAGDTVVVQRADDSRPPSDLVFGSRLNDPRMRLLWHRGEALQAEQSAQWFAAAHHLGQLLLLADAQDSAAALRVRRLRALTLAEVADAKAPQAAAKRPADKAAAAEQALADAYQAWDRPPHAVPWWLGRGAHAALLRQLRAAEGRFLLKPAEP